MPTTLLIVDSGAPGGQLPLDAGEQVVDVIPLQESIAQRLEERSPLRVGCAVLNECIPFRRERVELRFVLDAFAIDRLPRLLQPWLPLIGGGAGLSRSADFVE